MLRVFTAMLLAASSAFAQLPPVPALSSNFRITISGINPTSTESFRAEFDNYANVPFNSSGLPHAPQKANWFDAKLILQVRDPSVMIELQRWLEDSRHGKRGERDVTITATLPNDSPIRSFRLEDSLLVDLGLPSVYAEQGYGVLSQMIELRVRIGRFSIQQHYLPAPPAPNTSFLVGLEDEPLESRWMSARGGAPSLGAVRGVTPLALAGVVGTWGSALVEWVNTLAERKPQPRNIIIVPVPPAPGIRFEDCFIESYTIGPFDRAFIDVPLIETIVIKTMHAPSVVN